ncbi:hypothetical protein C8J56DRAFT_1035203, partial [Mycena floridula]
MAETSQKSTWGGACPGAGHQSWQKKNEALYPAHKYKDGFVPGCAGRPSAFFNRVQRADPSLVNAFPQTSKEPNEPDGSNN